MSWIKKNFSCCVTDYLSLTCSSLGTIDSGSPGSCSPLLPHCPLGRGIRAESADHPCNHDGSHRWETRVTVGLRRPAALLPAAAARRRKTTVLETWLHRNAFAGESSRQRKSEQIAAAHPKEVCWKRQPPAIIGRAGQGRPEDSRQRLAPCFICL